MWQSLADALAGEAFAIVAVALDYADAARPWIEAANATFPCLIDANHHVADLYNLVNVPQAVWIDENGRIVRPAEVAGSDDGFRAINRETGAMPESVLADRKRVKAAYMAAVADWVRNGSASANALDNAQATVRLQLPDDSVAEAHARFRLGQFLLRAGNIAEGQAQLDAATRLHPDSWAMWRQAAPKNERGLASGPLFWNRVDALGDRAYYPQPGIVAPQQQR